MAIEDFDSIFVHIGGFGRYQKMLFLVNCFMNCLMAFVYFGQIFMCLTPPHWCSAPPGLLALNLTQEELKNLTVPRDMSTGKFSQCRRYDVNFEEVVTGNVTWPNILWPTTNCTYGWTYDYSLYYPTITSQLNWVCEDDWRPAFTQTIFFVGSLLASPVLGWAADRVGRLPIIVITNVMGGVAGIISAFCNSFISFVIFRFFVGMTFDTNYTIAYILLLEYVSSEYRTIMSNVPIMIFLTLAMCAMPWIAVGVASWSVFTVIIHAPQLICIFSIWLLPESARWLLSQGRTEDTVKIVEKIAAVNKRQLTPEVIQEFKDYGSKQGNKDSTTVTVLDLLKTPVLRKRFLVLCLMWMMISVAYDGHMRNTEHIGNNVFITFTIAGFVEFPADFLTMIAIEKVGRRHTTVFTLVLSGVACLVISALSEVNTLAILGIAVAGRFMITMSINVAQQYLIEVLPTVARASGSSTIHSLGHVSLFISPYIIYLSKFGHFLPYVILGIVTIAGGLVCILLPETLNQNLPDTLHDGETFFGDQGFCYNPCFSGPKTDPYLVQLKPHSVESSTSPSSPKCE